MLSKKGSTPLPLLVVGALGVVFGDLGTSPLYSLHAVFTLHNGALKPTEEDILAVLSLIIWCLIIIVSVGYATFIMRADNKGEGGILSLVSSIRHRLGKADPRAVVATFIAIMGAGLFYGDSLITPAVSVMSAVEGLEVANPEFSHWVIPASIVILSLLFFVQRWGTGRIGVAFGPIMCCWFLTLGGLGLGPILDNPSILWALSPMPGLRLAVSHPFITFLALGAVVLTVTGVEALYADMGHFGRRPIVIAWFTLAFPMLILNYLGQGANLLRHPEALNNPFFELAPRWGQLPLVILATLATVIASQAVISGAFSVSRQASRLSFLPRLKVLQTSKSMGGQIYLPAVNHMLWIAVMALVLIFQSSQNLASAYGFSVSGTLILEMSLFLLMARTIWHWPIWRIALVALAIGSVEVAIFLANIAKLATGGWLPLMVAIMMVIIMTTWKKGSKIVFSRRAELEGPLSDFISTVKARGVRRVSGVAIYPHGNPTTAPLALRSSVLFNRVLHDHIVIVTIKHIGVPHVRHTRRVEVTTRGDQTYGIIHMNYRVGFNDSQNVPAAVQLMCSAHPEFGIDPTIAQYVLSTYRIEPGKDKGVRYARSELFRWLERMGANRTQSFKLPLDRTIVVGASVEV